MGGRGPESDGLLKKARRDFEIARRYREAKEFVKASIIYNSAIERVLTALYRRKTHRNPPKSASLAYLATQTDIPREISEEIMSLEDERADVEEEELELERGEEFKQPVEQIEYNRVLSKGTIAKRLIIYAQAKQ